MAPEYAVLRIFTAQGAAHRKTTTTASRDAAAKDSGRKSCFQP